MRFRARVRLRVLGVGRLFEWLGGGLSFGLCVVLTAARLCLSFCLRLVWHHVMFSVRYMKVQFG